MKRILAAAMLLTATALCAQHLSVGPKSYTGFCLATSGASSGLYVPINTSANSSVVPNPPTSITLFGYDGTNYDVLTCDSNGNISAGAILGATIPALAAGCLDSAGTSGPLSWTACGGTFNALTGDATSTSTGGATTVVGVNGTQLSGLSTGILYNTTLTGVPSITTAAQMIAGFGSGIGSNTVFGNFTGAPASPTFSATPAFAITSLTGTCAACTANSANAVNTNTFPAAAGFTSGGVPYFSSTSAVASSALLTAHGLLVGGGAGAAPAALGVGGANFPLIGQASANPAFSTIAYPASLTSGGVLYASSTTAIASSSTVTAHGLLVSEGAGTAPVALAVAGTNFPIVGSAAADPVVSTIAYPASLTSGGFLYASSTTAIAGSALITANVIPKSGGAGAQPVATSITDDGKNITTTEVFVGGNKSFVTADFTDSTSTTLQLVTGLSWTLPTSKAVNVSFHCMLLFDQATAAVSDSIGIGVTGTAPTQANASAVVYTNTTVSTAGTLTALASTTPTAVVTFTPSAITTIWEATLNGTIEQPSNATPGVFGVYVATTTGTDNFIVKRGSYCSLF